MKSLYKNHPKHFLSSTSSNTGVSDEYNLLQDSFVKIRQHDQETASGQNLSQVRSLLFETFYECREPNWDGYDAQGISEKAYFEAVKLLEFLPPYLPLPEIVPEPTGELGFEWQSEKNFVYVISVGGHQQITYAGMFGQGNETHGTENFTGTIPRIIIEHILRVCLPKK